MQYCTMSYLHFRNTDLCYGHADYRISVVLRRFTVHYHSTYRATTIMLPYDDEYYHVTAYYCRTYHTMTMVLPYDEKCYHIL